MVKKEIKELLTDYFAVLLMLGVFALLIWHRWVGYWLIYKPLYAMFPDSLLLPLYLHHVGWVICAIGMIVLGLWAFRGAVKMVDIACKIFFVAGGAAAIFISCRATWSDIEIFKAEGYRTQECDVNTLSKYIGAKSKGSRYYYILGIEDNATTIEMNFYQYRQLLKIQKQTGGEQKRVAPDFYSQYRDSLEVRRRDSSRIVTVQYLPNTRRMLKFEWRLDGDGGDNATTVNRTSKRQRDE